MLDEVDRSLPSSGSAAIEAERAAALTSAKKTLAIEVVGLTTLAEAFDGPLGPAFAEALRLMRAARGRIIVTGMGKSGHIARKIAASLASTGTPAFFVHPAEASHGDLGMITADDAILALSWSGETVELRDLVHHAGRHRVALIAMTAEADSTLAKAADVVLALPRASEACPHGLAPTTSTTMQLALGDALTVALLESRGFTASDFRLFHPGGKLGASLTWVRDLMHRGDRMPLVPLGTPMSDAILVISAKSFGCVGILDAAGGLAGIVTDGDLRRHMAPGFIDKLVEEVMTAMPLTVPPDSLAAEALEIMSSAKITSLFVVEDGRPVGILHVHDALRIGVA
ncbi:MAG TPA: KpsF/GutQ family sugar-phosphate isomerase [Hyphomicrobiales bacterium]|nr:KpsF/GutQ family sugar-phosphate isomerase [Hyphomicrobiales bacterium]